MQRVFEECQTYEGEMDFKSFLDFVLAIQVFVCVFCVLCVCVVCVFVCVLISVLPLQNRSSRPAQLYLFKMLDINKRGYIAQFEIHYFFRYVRELLIDHGHQPPEIEDVCDEIFDMVKPADANKITLGDLTASAVAETVRDFSLSLSLSLSLSISLSHARERLSRTRAQALFMVSLRPRMAHSSFWVCR